jgi:hypothetical protein
LNWTGFACLRSAPVARGTKSASAEQSQKEEEEGHTKQFWGFLEVVLSGPFTLVQTDANVSANIAQSPSDRGGLLEPQ